MKIIPYLLMFLCSGSGSAIADQCVSAAAKAETEKVLIPGYQSGRMIVGKGRAYFFASPHIMCGNKKVFVVPGDQVNAYAEYNEFTWVLYLHPKTGVETEGWLLTERLEPTGTGIAPNYDEKQ